MKQGASLLRRLAACVVLLLPAAAAAEPMRLGAGDIKQTFTGTRVELDTPLGTTIPIKFTGDGLMSGSAGSLASVLGAANDRGRWWVKGDRLCYKWFRWFDAEEQCLTIHMKQERVFWRRDDGKRGTATIVDRPPQVAEVKPAARNAAAPVTRTASIVGSSAPLRAQARLPVLKSPPRLAERPITAAEQLGLPDEAPADRSLFFVGLGLARALQSQFAVTAAEAAPAPASSRSAAAKIVPLPVKKEVVAAVPVPSAPPYPYPETGGSGLARPAVVSFSVYGVEDDDVLNMRSGPSDDYAIVGVIPPNASNVRMVGRCISLWCEIQFRNTRGWVNRYYLAQN
jgi:hypothetical protein